MKMIIMKMETNNLPRNNVYNMLNFGHNLETD